MKIDIQVKVDAQIHIHNHGSDDALRTLLERTRHMSQEIDDLVREVTETKEITASVIVLLGDIKRRLDEAIAANDMTLVKQAAADLDANQAAIAAAIVANTPADPQPTP